jgi:hypothetical protein
MFKKPWLRPVGQLFLHIFTTGSKKINSKRPAIALNIFFIGLY